MDHEAIQNKLTEVLHSVFQDDTIILNDEFSADDIEAWDSMNHIVLIMEIEKVFSVKFSNADLAGLENIGDLINLIKRYKT